MHVSIISAKLVVQIITYLNSSQAPECQSPGRRTEGRWEGGGHKAITFPLPSMEQGLKNTSTGANSVGD